MAMANGEMINFTRLANDYQVPPSTVTEYVGLLEEYVCDRSKNNGFRANRSEFNFLFFHGLQGNIHRC